MKPLVFISGPYTSPDPVLNVRKACQLADRLDDAGAAVIVPHLSMLWHLASPADVDTWYRRDLDVLAHCDALVRFSGPSAGADREWEVARDLDLERWALPEGFLRVSPRMHQWIDAFAVAFGGSGDAA